MSDESYSGPVVRFPATSEWIAAVLALAPFICNMTTVSYSTSNGRVTAFSYSDMAAIILGGLAVIAALSNLRLLSQTAPDQKIIRIVVVIVLVGVGVFQIMRGLGMFIDPQSYVNSLR
ncbi:MAG: hypothetical protein H6672_01150 [Anaerolineaceae bacterium]|nr:hypothetical protein [Anaerolineaceae bacterium]